MTTVAEDLAIYAIHASGPFGERVARHLGVSLSGHEEREFEDGEHKIRPLDDPRGRDVFVIHSLYSDESATVNDKLVRLLVFIGALRDASAARVTAVIPYLAYARKDKRTQPFDPVTTRYIARLIEAAGADRVMTIDVHNLAAFENAFQIPKEHLEATPVFVAHFKGMLGLNERPVVISPDAGGLKRAGAFREALSEATGEEVGLGFMDKTRELGRLSAGRLYGDVQDATAIIIDDMISTGGTLTLAAEHAKEQGARRVYAAASHGVFVGNAAEALGREAIDNVIVTDTVPPARLPQNLVERKLSIVSCAPLFADAIRRVHFGAVTGSDARSR